MCCSPAVMFVRETTRNVARAGCHCHHCTKKPILGESFLMVSSDHAIAHIYIGHLLTVIVMMWEEKESIKIIKAFFPLGEKLKTQHCLVSNRSPPSIHPESDKPHLRPPWHGRWSLVGPNGHRSHVWETRSRVLLSRGFYTSYPSWTDVPLASLPSWTGPALLVVMVCWLLGRTECNYASELCGRRRQGRTIPGPGDKILGGDCVAHCCAIFLC